MPKVLASPLKYIQGPGELSNIQFHLSHFDGPILFVMTGFAHTHLKNLINESYKKSEILIFEKFNGECTKNEIERFRTIYHTHSCKTVVGIGGGKAIDTAKGVAFYENCPVISIPTIASTDAPTSAIAVTYTDDHVFDGNLLLSKNPDLVLVDTTIILNAPVRFLVAGMGDALSTYFEARANEASGHENFVGGKPTNTSFALAKLCYDLLIRDGLKAKTSADKKEWSKEFENIIEANIYLSGVGFESNGLACAHSVYNALTILPNCHHMYHGELVAFGAIVQLILENRPEEEITEVIKFCLSIGLPVSLRDISNQELTPDDIIKVAKVACSPENFMASEPFEVTPEMVIDAMNKLKNFGN
ncbi:glycerol dehydrogenase [Methanospirillum stamsii]|uniref:Glycerol dehydrogenase n=1 Tax=Methanospirillum stamsii TaxID=1277351 RepID=A0A2V2MSR2_9EURY|nr:glycerol dehydrogenase [Methanospirillum stamsii]